MPYTTQQARANYREPIGGFYVSGKDRGKPYLRSGFSWGRVTYLAGGSSYPSGKVSLRVHPAVVPAHQALAAVFLFHRYAFRETAGGTVSMRNITGASSAAITRQIAEQFPFATSLHAHGLPIDINPSKNPYGSSKPDELDLPKWRQLIADAKAIETIDGHRVFKWGGDWSNDDDMHFEPTNCTRPQLVRGISTASIRGWNEYVAWLGGSPIEVEVIMKRGDKGQTVAELQKALADLWGMDNGSWTPMAGKSAFDGKAFGPGQDGIYGTTCENNVKAVQKKLGLPETGVADATTVALVFAKYGSAGSAIDSVARAEAKRANDSLDKIRKE